MNFQEVKHQYQYMEFYFNEPLTTSEPIKPLEPVINIYDFIKEFLTH